jgi:hypothetical protein
MTPARGGEGESDARRDMIATLVTVGVFAAAFAWHALARRLSARPSRDECVELFQRYADAQAKAVNPDGLPRGKRGQALPRAPERKVDARSPEVERCVTSLTREEAECARKATNADDFERCIP